MEFDAQCILDQLNQRDAIELSPVLVIFGFIVLLGSIGNAVSLYIYSRNFKDSNARCFFILLSVVEFFSSTTSVPMEIYNLVTHYNFSSDRLCKTFVFTEICQVEIGYVLLVLIAVDRWRKVCHPFGRQISVTMAKAFCFALIPIGIIVASPSLALYGRHYFDVEIDTSGFKSCPAESGHNYTLNVSRTVRATRCSVTNEALEGVLPTLYTILFWCLFLTGTAVLTILYVQIIQSIRVQDVKRDRSIHRTEKEESTRYKPPKYAPRESIFIDGDTDQGVRISGINTSYTETEDDEHVSKETNVSSNKAGGLSNKPFCSSPVRYDSQVKSYMITQKTVKKLHDSLPKHDKLPQIKIIEVKSFSFANKDFTKPVKSKTAIPDSVLLSPFTKRKFHIKRADKAPDVNISVVEENVIDVFSKIGIKDNHQAGLSDKNLEVTNLDVKDNEVLPKQSRYRTFVDLCKTNELPPIEENFMMNSRIDNIRNEIENDTNEKEKSNSRDIFSQILKRNIPDNEEAHITNSRYKDARKSVPNDSSSVILPSQANPLKIGETQQNKDIEMNGKSTSTTGTAFCTLASKFKVGTLKRQTTKRQTRSRNVTTVMLAITISNVICFLPYLILSLLRSLITDFETNLNDSARVAYSLFVRSMYFKSVTNPIIYGLFDSRYRQVLLKVARRPQCRT